MKFKKVKDSGARENMTTGSRRDTQKGKSRPDLNNPLVIRRLGMHMANGCDKYGEHNYELGQKTSRYLASLERHLLDYKEGLDDEDHAAAIMWNIHGIIMNQEFVERGIYPPEMDDYSDYRTKQGFDCTVGKRAKEFNDELRKAEDTISDVTYGNLEEPEHQYLNAADYVIHPNKMQDVPQSLAHLDEPCENVDCTRQLKSEKPSTHNAWNKPWSREDDHDAEVDAAERLVPRIDVDQVIADEGQCNCPICDALKNDPKVPKMLCNFLPYCLAKRVDDDHEGCDVQYLCGADTGETCEYAERKF